MRPANLLMQKLSNSEHYSEESGMCPSSYSDYRKFMLKIVIPQNFGMIHLMQAFDTNAISYLLKPIDREQINAALDKYSSMQEVFQAKTPLEKMGTLISQLNYQYKSSLLINYGDKIIPIKIENIACFYWEETRLLIITGNNQQFYYNSSLDEIQKQLNPDLFYRGNRQFIINRTFVTGAERYFTRRLIAKLSVDTPEKIIISKEKSSAFLEWLSNQS
ncbi:DNA-binding response regulator [Bacteroidaceae bacterium HV4-6-C5C]|nr:DNA-binding response regulator [Bacteroidaceae bacterium HV4-6-C5C]